VDVWWVDGSIENKVNSAFKVKLGRACAELDNMCQHYEGGFIDKLYNLLTIKIGNSGADILLK
jgi:hypothetical protein